MKLKKILTATAASLLFVATLVPSPASAAARPSEILLGNMFLDQFNYSKTLDVSSLDDVNVKITPQDRANIKATAQSKTDQWVERNTKTGNGGIADSIKDSFRYTLGSSWWPNYASPEEMEDEIQRLYDNFGVRNYDPNGEYTLKDSALEPYIERKLAEYENTLLSDLFKERVAGKLDYTFNFRLVEPADKVDNPGKIKEGRSYIPFSEVSFGGNDQLYDEILNTAARNGIDENSAETVLPDGRDILTHSLLFDRGTFFSSDESQISWGEKLLRDNPRDWSGWHFLLEVGDNLNTYSTDNPEWSYVRTFNLHLNPAVDYVCGEIKSDLVTDAKFDEAGNLISISKPLIPSDCKTPKVTQTSDGWPKMEGTSFTDYYAQVISNIEKCADLVEGWQRFELAEELNGDFTNDADQKYYVDVYYEKTRSVYGTGDEIKIKFSHDKIDITNKKVPEKPDTPDVPVTPDEPDKPDTPDEPDTPVVPEKPDKPDKPDKKEKVEKPEKKVEKDTPKKDVPKNKIFHNVPAGDVLPIIPLVAAGIGAALLAVIATIALIRRKK